MEHELNALVSAAVLYAPRFALSLLAFLSFWLVAAVLHAVIGRLGRRALVGADVLTLIQRVTKVGLLVVGLVTALGTLGLDVSALVAGLGLTGFALGFALKDVLSNLLAGVLILIYRPFHRHDRVMVAGFEGTIADIDLRYTTLEAEDRRILIPNATLFTNAISVLHPTPATGPVPSRP
ncbi:MAG TPA: mechanosensitive ion channel domain-containing protein [Methylomirabilota bacterium]|jgi:small-conductance mechanosensitive channel|nr:mechanosensitive ion channel domain-containing protein [Methylomirabilota bacterium]